MADVDVVTGALPLVPGGWGVRDDGGVDSRLLPDWLEPGDGTTGVKAVRVVNVTLQVAEF